MGVKVTVPNAHEVRAVVFDVGETLVDETRAWSLHADALGVPRFTFFALLGAVIAQGGHHHEVFALARPDLTLDEARRALRAPAILGQDLYPDVLPCLSALRERGLKVGLAGNQPSEAEALLRALGLPVDFVATSAGWGVAKPSARFFELTARECGEPPERVAYVGDRLDNDVLPARAAGMFAVFLRRGPWGYLHALDPRVRKAHLQLESLVGLPDVLTRGVAR